jgi:hypothetical protein
LESEPETLNNKNVVAAHRDTMTITIFRDGIRHYQCPNCKKVYKPTFENKEDAPAGTIEKEQHITGMCSDKCWDEFLGVS